MDLLFSELSDSEIGNTNNTNNYVIDIDIDNDNDDLGFADEIQYIPNMSTHTRNPYDPSSSTNINMAVLKQKIPSSSSSSSSLKRTTASAPTNIPISHKSLISSQQYIIKTPVRPTTSTNGSNGNSANGNSTNGKSKLSYDDILSSLNMHVVNGKLQISSSATTTLNGSSSSSIGNNNSNSNKYYTNINNNIPQHLPIQPKPIHSQLHNQLHNQLHSQKYRQQQQQSVEIPIINNYSSTANSAPILTREQYKRIVLTNYIRQQNYKIAEKNRIKNVKSTKLLFTAENASPIIYTNVSPTLNRLFTFVGR